MLVVNGENPWHLALSDSPVTQMAYKMSLDIKQLRSDIAKITHLEHM